MNVRRWVLLSLWSFPLLAAAQPAAAPAVGADKPAVTFNEIERGAYVRLSGGGLFLFNAPENGPFSPGTVAAMEVGFDIGERLAIGAFVQFSSNKAGADYLGKSGGLASGDYSALVPGAALRVNILGINDGQEVRRTWIYIRAGGGYVLFSPKALLPDSDVLLFGGPGVEYYTRLRHFSVGLELTGSYFVASASPGIAVTPTVRYAF